MYTNHRMVRNITRKIKRGGGETPKLSEITPQKYMGAMSPYTFMFQHRDNGMYSCDFISVEDKGYKFFTVTTSAASSADAKQSLRAAIRTQKKRTPPRVSHTVDTPFEILPQRYTGVMAPYRFMIQEKGDGRYYCDFISLKGGAYTFYRVFTSLSTAGDPKQRLRAAIRKQKAADATVAAP